MRKSDRPSPTQWTAAWLLLGADAVAESPDAERPLPSRKDRNEKLGKGQNELPEAQSAAALRPREPGADDAESA